MKEKCVQSEEHPLTRAFKLSEKIRILLGFKSRYMTSFL